MAPKSLQLDPNFFSHPGNILSLLKFLKRTNLIDVSLKVLSVYYSYLTSNDNLSGKLVYNYLAKIWMQSLSLIQYTLKPNELPLKDIKIAKTLVMKALPLHNKRSLNDSDYEFLRNSKINSDHIKISEEFDGFP